MNDLPRGYGSAAEEPPLDTREDLDTVTERVFDGVEHRVWKVMQELKGIQKTVRSEFTDAGYPYEYSEGVARALTELGMYWSDK